jgi:hypothetical protein
MGVSGSAPGSNDVLGMTSYSKDFHQGRVSGTETGCHVSGHFLETRNLLHDCSQTSGSSGASLYREEQGLGGKTAYYVAGVNSAGIYITESNYGQPVPFDNSRANVLVPAAHFLPKLKAIIAAEPR